jgi:putative ABC transport system ATP-binding protein
MSDQTTAVRASRLSKSYGEEIVLDSIDVSFERGELTAVMGPPAAGKSTLLHCLAGLEKPTSGRIYLGTDRLTGLDDEALSRMRRDRVGFIFQSYNLLPTLTVAENIMLPFELAGRIPDQDFADRVVDAVGLRDKLMHLPGKLSGGQRQRVATARALMLKPDVVFADEPTAALDVHGAADVIELLRHSVDELHQTVVMVTHDPVVAARADRVVFFEAGNIATELRSPSAEGVSERMKALERRRRMRDGGGR